MRAYLGEREVDEAVFAMALPVDADWVHLTNSPWAFSIEETRKALGIERLTVINDFSAQALAIPALTARERLQLGAGAPVEGAPIGVIGPGTGLGVGALLRIGDTWQPVASEGGHVSLAPRDEVDAAVWPSCASASAMSPTSACCPGLAWSTSRRRSRRSRERSCRSTSRAR